MLCGHPRARRLVPTVMDDSHHGQMDNAPSRFLDPQAEVGLLGVDEEPLVEQAGLISASRRASMNEPDVQSQDAPARRSPGSSSRSPAQAREPAIARSRAPRQGAPRSGSGGSSATARRPSPTWRTPARPTFGRSSDHVDELAERAVEDLGVGVEEEDVRASHVDRARGCSRARSRGSALGRSAPAGTRSRRARAVPSVDSLSTTTTSSERRPRGRRRVARHGSQPAAPRSSRRR